MLYLHKDAHTGIYLVEVFLPVLCPVIPFNPFPFGLCLMYIDKNIGRIVAIPDYIPKWYLLLFVKLLTGIDYRCFILEIFPGGK